MAAGPRERARLAMPGVRRELGRGRGELEVSVYPLHPGPAGAVRPEAVGRLAVPERNLVPVFRPEQPRDGQELARAPGRPPEATKMPRDGRSPSRGAQPSAGDARVRKGLLSCRSAARS